MGTALIFIMNKKWIQIISSACLSWASESPLPSSQFSPETPLPQFPYEKMEGCAWADINSSHPRPLKTNEEFFSENT
jgi:hypothetical protein